tara:strand:+ start:679 stop:882 length:204 start_codon:yes stop_codon:yes gene_type:complete
MKKILNILAFWILWAVVLLIGIISLFGLSLTDGILFWMSLLGAVSSVTLLFVMMDDPAHKQDTHYDR